MKDPNYLIRKAFYDALNGVISCPVYNRVPNNAAKPYVLLGSQNTNDSERTKDYFLYEHSIVLEIVTGNSSMAGGDKEADDIASEIGLIICPVSPTDYIQPDKWFNIISIELESSNSIDEDTETEVTNRRLLRYKMIIDETGWVPGIGTMIIGSTFIVA
jgi:hypothetical protein